MILRKVLITGGTGYLGSRLARTFLKKGIEVGILSRGQGPGYLAEIAEKCKFYSFDPDGVEQATMESSADVLVHCATCYGRNGESHSELIRANFVNPLEVYQAANGRVGFWINIGTGLSPNVSPYAKSKSLLVDWIQCHPGGGVPWVDLALQHFYGPGEDPSKFLAFVANRCLGSEELDLTDGLQCRDFIHVDDVLRAINHVIDRRGTINSGSRFEVGTGVAVPVRHVVEMLHEMLRSRTKLNFGVIPRRKAEPELCVADITEMSNLGWEPEVRLEDGLRRLADEITVEYQRKANR